jgi:FtsP/CotA-like multicopper oxidase with cupredoxin domain
VGVGGPAGVGALIVAVRQAVAVDRDEVLLFEDWRLRPDGTAIAPGIDPNGTSTAYTVNRHTALDIPTRTHERLRLRFINGFQRNVIAIKIEKHDIQVMALDGQPSEPFPARNGALVLAPGGRADAFIDAALAPGTVSSILLHDLKTALRIDLPVGGSQAGWITPSAFTASLAPAFKARAGRIVVLALTNRADKATTFYLHGHHFRLLDRLDDGWKPFWLDTLAIEPGKTERIAFAAETAGRWLLEAMAADWAAPRLLRWYAVE